MRELGAEAKQPPATENRERGSTQTNTQAVAKRNPEPGVTKHRADWTGQAVKQHRHQRQADKQRRRQNERGVNPLLPGRHRPIRSGCRNFHLWQALHFHCQ